MSRKEARDRRDAAVHEAAHLVVARQIQQEEGISRPAMRACIYRVNGTTSRGRTWNGTFKFFPFDMPPLKKAMIGVAGVVAVTLWRRGRLQELHWDDPNTMSREDWDICGCEPGQAMPELPQAILEVSALLKRDTGLLWWKLCVEARHLITHRKYP
jgi:hypothetical protein